MKGRLVRLKALRKFIHSQKFKSQEALLSCLRDEGFAVTQATLSRDLKMLKVGKVSDGSGAYVYFLPGEEEPKQSERTYINDFLQGYISIDWSGNIVVVKTRSGHADPVCLALDSFDMEEVLGTIAGRDDTVALFLREGVSGEDFMKRMKEIMPELD